MYSDDLDARGASNGSVVPLIRLSDGRSKGVVFTHFEEDHQSIARSSGASYPAPANTSANTVHVDPTRVVPETNERAFLDTLGQAERAILILCPSNFTRFLMFG